MYQFPWYVNLIIPVFLIMAAVAAVFGAIIIGDFPYAGQHLLG
jgi:hypothetical protein